MPYRKKPRPRTSFTKRQKKEIVRVVNDTVETKTIDQNAGGPCEIWSATTRIHSLTPISQGINDHERIGNDVYLKRLLLRVLVGRDPTKAPLPTPTTWRVTVFKWDRDSAPTAAELYTAGNIALMVNDLFYQEHKGFILKDDIITLTTGTNNKVKNYDIKLNFRNTYHGALASNDSKGMVYVAIGGLSATVDDAYTLGSRVFYKDM